MASVNFKKLHNGSGEAAAMIGHMLRHDGRDVTYRNRDVDPALSERNYFVNNKRFDDSTEMVLAKLQKRVASIDQEYPPKRIRADRVTLISYTIPCPEGLSEDEQRDFFDIVHEEISRMSGGRQNVSCGVVHMDEIHEYVDKDGTVKTSRPHMHMVGIPFVEGVGINGKNFETRDRMKALNKRIDERCRQELFRGFLTHQEPSKQSVEDLKLESYKVLQERSEKLERASKRQLNQLAIGRRVLDRLEDFLVDLEKEYDIVQTEELEDIHRDLQELDILQDLLDIAEDPDILHYQNWGSDIDETLYPDDDDGYDEPSYWYEEPERSDRGFDLDL